MLTGQLIRLYRIDRKKSPVSVATHAGITVRYLEMIEAGTKTPSLPVLRKLTKVLGVRTSALIGEAPSEDHEGQQVAALSAMRLNDPWRARELLRGPAWEAAARVGEGRNDHNIFFGPTNVRIHMVHVEQQVGEISDALRLADDVDITKIPPLERKTTHLYELARCYDCRNNDTAVFVYLKMAERLCPQDFQHKREARSRVSTLVNRSSATARKVVVACWERVAAHRRCPWYVVQHGFRLTRDGPLGCRTRSYLQFSGGAVLQVGCWLVVVRAGSGHAG